MPWNITGNARAVSAVARSLASDSPPHAYLLTGPDRVGKATLALRLAQALNCERPVGARHPSHRDDVPDRDEDLFSETPVDQGGASPLRPDPGSSPAPFPAAGPPPSSFLLPPSSNQSPCLLCTPCTRIANGLHADVQTVTVELNDDGDQKTAIAVDQVREVERSIALNPYEGRTRVVIIDPADLLTDEAQNAFLKTLEEPPPHVVLVLIATRDERLLPTVHSRCRRIEFHPVPAAEIEAALVAEGSDPAQASLLGRLARGRPGWALEMGRDPAAFQRRRSVLEAARSIAGLPLHKRVAIAEEMAGAFRTGRDEMYGRLTEWAGWWRDVMLVQSGADDAVANVDMLAALREDAARYRRSDVIAFARAVLAAVEHLRANVQPRAALELLVLEAPASARP